jgi:hypothetical protein
VVAEVGLAVPHIIDLVVPSSRPAAVLAEVLQVIVNILLLIHPPDIILAAALAVTNLTALMVVVELEIIQPAQRQAAAAAV